MRAKGRATRSGAGRYSPTKTSSRRFRKNARQAAIYPALFIAWGSGEPVPAALLVPSLSARIYEEPQVDLPFFSKILLSWGQLVEGHGDS